MEGLDRQAGKAQEADGNQKPAIVQSETRWDQSCGGLPIVQEIEESQPERDEESTKKPIENTASDPMNESQQISNVGHQPRDFSDNQCTAFPEHLLTKIRVPRDNSLCWAATLAYLIPIKNYGDCDFKRKVQRLCDDFHDSNRIKNLKNLIEEYNPFSDEIQNIFKKEVFKDLVQKFGSKVHVTENQGCEMNFICNTLHVPVSVYCDPNTSSHFTPIACSSKSMSKIILFLVDSRDDQKYYNFALEDSTSEGYHMTQSRWSNFDDAVDLKKIFGVSDKSEVRKELVKSALSKSSEEDYRKLLAPEILRAVVLINSMNKDDPINPYFLPQTMRCDASTLINNFVRDETKGEEKEAVDNLIEYCSSEETYKQYVDGYYSQKVKIGFPQGRPPSISTVNDVESIRSSILTLANQPDTSMVHLMAELLKLKINLYYEGYMKKIINEGGSTQIDLDYDLDSGLFGPHSIRVFGSTDSLYDKYHFVSLDLYNDDIPTEEMKNKQLDEIEKCLKTDKVPNVIEYIKNVPSNKKNRMFCLYLVYNSDKSEAYIALSGKDCLSDNQELTLPVNMDPAYILLSGKDWLYDKQELTLPVNMDPMCEESVKIQITSIQSRKDEQFKHVEPLAYNDDTRYLYLKDIIEDCSDRLDLFNKFLFIITQSEIEEEGKNSYQTLEKFDFHNDIQILKAVSFLHDRVIESKYRDDFKVEDNDAVALKDYVEKNKDMKDQQILIKSLEILWNKLKKYNIYQICKILGQCAEDNLVDFLQKNPDILNKDGKHYVIHFQPKTFKTKIALVNKNKRTQEIFHEFCPVCVIWFEDYLEYIKCLSIVKPNQCSVVSTLEEIFPFHGVYINLPNKHDKQNTLLHYAAKNGRIDDVKFLLRHGAIYNAKNEDNEEPKCLAQQNSEINILLERIDNAFQPLQKNYTLELYLNDAEIVNARRRDDGKTLLHIALFRNGQNVINQLLNSKSINVNACDNNGQTPLHYAAQYAGKYIMDLLKKGAVTNIADANGQIPLHLAAKNGNVEELLKLNVDVKEENYDAKESELFSPDKEGHIPLHLAAINGRTNAVKSFLNFCNRGLAPTDRPTRTCTWRIPVRYPKNREVISEEIKGNQRIVKMILCTNNASKTSLELSAERGHNSVVQELLHLKYPTDCSFSSVSRSEAYKLYKVYNKSLLLASQNGHTEVVKTLLEKGACVNARDNDGMTSLHWAAKNTHLEVTQLLITKKASANRKDKNGKTPFDLALESSTCATETQEKLYLIAGLLMSITDKSKLPSPI